KKMFCSREYFSKENICSCLTFAGALSYIDKVVNSGVRASSSTEHKTGYYSRLPAAGADICACHDYVIDTQVPVVLYVFFE
ncbi:MAG TPA: hypothetical protein PK114_09865, partial [Smithellaceae bacterium]|nr:hypothetical protein [Smithellaceae bacterium]